MLTEDYIAMNFNPHTSTKEFIYVFCVWSNPPQIGEAVILATRENVPNTLSLCMRAAICWKTDMEDGELETLDSQ